MSQDIFAVLVDCKNCERRFASPFQIGALTELAAWVALRERLACRNCGVEFEVEANDVSFLQDDLRWHRLDGDGI